MTDLAVYAGLFLTALAAATILPMQSEAVLTGLLVLDSHPVWLLVAVASVGNVLGSVFNWVLGRGIESFRDRKWFPRIRKHWSEPQYGTDAMANGRCCFPGCRSSAIR